MALPFDALTAALDAWLGQHIPNETRRARVRRAVDCLDDLRTAPLSHIEFATDVPPRKNDTLVSRYRYTGRERTLLQLVHGDLVDLRVELALADLLARDAPVVLGHRRARLRGHFRT